MEKKPIFTVGQEVEVLVSTGYMGSIKKSRRGFVKSISPYNMHNNAFYYDIETRTETNRVSTLNRKENEIKIIVEPKIHKLFKKVFKKIGEANLKSLGISSEDIAYLKLNLGVEK